MKPLPVYKIHPDGSIDSDKFLLTVDEAAHLLGMSPKSLRNKVAPGSSNPLDNRIKVHRIGRTIRFYLKDILKITEGDAIRHADEGDANERDGAMPDLQAKAKAGK
jgi:hypothetical protein